MTVATSTSRIQHNCGGSVVAFAFGFGVGATSEIQVILTDSNGTETVLTETTHYVISATNDDYESGGTVTTVATYAAGNTLTILRNVPITQESDFTENMPTLYEVFEDGLDKLTRINQQYSEVLGRALRIKKSSELSGSDLELPTPQAGLLLGWNAAEDGLENKAGAGDIVGFTAYMETLLDDADAAEARETLGIDAYNINYAAVDQGVTGNNDTIKYAVDTIAANNGTIFLRHNSGAATTTYTLSTSEVIPANINLIIEKGAIIAIDNGITLTINGPFSAGLYQVFSGIGTVSFGDGSIEEVHPEWWGASPSATAAANTTVFQTTLNIATNQGIPLKIGVGTYLLNNLTLNYVGAGSAAAITIEGSGNPEGGLSSELTTTRVGGTILKSEMVDGSHFITPTINFLGPVLIKNLMIQGPDTDATTTSGDAIHFDVSGSGCPLRLENLSIHHFRGGRGVYSNLAIGTELRNVNLNHNDIGLYAISANASNYYNCVFQFNSDYAIKLYGTLNANFYGALIQANLRHGVYQNGCSGIAFYSGYWEANNQDDLANTYDLFLEGTAGIPVYEPSFYNCRFIVKAGAVNPTQISMVGVASGNVLHPTFIQCRKSATLPIAFGASVVGYYTINSPDFSSPRASGIYFGQSLKETCSVKAIAFVTPWEPDWALGGFFEMTLTGNIVVSAPIGALTGGERLTIIFKQDAAGGRTVTWNAVYKNAPAVHAGANEYTYYQFLLNEGAAALIHVE